MSEVRYFCSKCGYEVKDIDTTCPNCKGVLSEVGRNITVVLTESVGITESLSVGLTKAEQATLKRIFSWLKQRVGEMEFESVELGFPSGIKFKFTKHGEK